MNTTLDQLYQRLDTLQQEIRRELQQTQKRFAYRLERGRVIFGVFTCTNDVAAIKSARKFVGYESVDT